MAEILKYQQERHCYIKLDTERTQPLKIPFVRDYSLTDENLLEYEKELYDAQNAVAGPDADRLLKENETRFLTAAHAAIDITPASEPQIKNITPQHVPSSTTKKKTVFDTVDIDSDPIGRE